MQRLRGSQTLFTNLVLTFPFFNHSLAPIFLAGFGVARSMSGLGWLALAGLDMDWLTRPWVEKGTFGH